MLFMKTNVNPSNTFYRRIAHMSDFRPGLIILKVLCFKPWQLSDGALFTLQLFKTKIKILIMCNDSKANFRLTMNIYFRSKFLYSCNICCNARHCMQLLFWHKGEQRCSVSGLKTVWQIQISGSSVHLWMEEPSTNTNFWIITLMLSLQNFR